MKKVASPIFRPLKEKDLMEIYYIDKLCFEPGISYELQTIFFFFYYLETISFVAELEGRIAGFIMANIKKKSRAHIITLDILPDFRRRGLASRLLKLLEKELINKGVNSISLEVNVDNKTAINLYEKWGYTKIKRLRNYYMNRRDAYFMEKELPKGE